MLRQDVTENTVKKTGFKPHLRAKIDAKCRSCIYDSHAEGSWRKQSENCTSFACPLYEVRPVTTGGASK